VLADVAPQSRPAYLALARRSADRAIASGRLRPVDADALLDATLAYANILAGYTHTGLSMTKEVLWHNIDAQSMDAAIAMENRNQNIANQAADVREYMLAYRDRITKR